MFVKYEHNWEHNHLHRYVRILKQKLHLLYSTKVLVQVPQTQMRRLGSGKYQDICQFVCLLPSSIGYNCAHWRRKQGRTYQTS